MDTIKSKALAVLATVYGYKAFRPGQWEIIEQIMSGRDAVVLMPTGGGKSLCFQVPALLSAGCCIVVSPLIALMHDQVEALRANGIAAAEFNSLQSEDANRRAMEDACGGRLKLLYVSPERLVQDLDMIVQNVPISFFAVDEAHCISQWGHDFRPVYTQLNKLKEKCPQLPVVALTATADRLTRADIATTLGLVDPFNYVGSFDRPNLSLTAVSGATKKERLTVISNLIDKFSGGCGIVYCISRKKTEDMANALTAMGYKARCYHAGMGAQERTEVQRAFIEGKLSVVCATVAFGMGIDKSNVRWVVHNNLPGNIESYYQEIGRAGRDGLPAETVLFYSYADVITRREFLKDSGQQEINIRKLEFMQRYAEASVCRRRILLSYFNEQMEHDCGNCDNCRNPRNRIDGTLLAQKALSAVVRVHENEPMNVIIDILRGLRNSNVLTKSYDRLPTYGVGRDTDAGAWHSYILQMVQLGLVEVRYEDRLRLGVTPLGWKVLRGQSTVELAQYIPYMAIDKRAEDKRRKKDILKDSVMQLTPQQKVEKQLRKLRDALAVKNSMADYMVFSDVTLKQLAETMPLTFDDLVAVEGMSAVRIGAYGKEIVRTIARALGRKDVSVLGWSPLITKMMYDNSMDVDAIADARHFAPSTVVGHLLELHAQGHNVDLWRIVPREVYERLLPAMETLDTATEDNRALMYEEVRKECQARYGVTSRQFSDARRIYLSLNPRS